MTGFVTGHGRIISLVSRFALLLCLLVIAVFVTVRTTLGDEDTWEKQSPVTEVVKRGPSTVEDIQWTLDSLKVYTRLVGKDGEPVDLDVPDGATIVMATLTLTPTDRARLDDGFTCDADLADDRGNVWQTADAFGVSLPTFCGDDDLVVRRGRPVKVAKVYLVPKEAVPHLTGLITPRREVTSAERRVLLTP